MKLDIKKFAALKKGLEDERQAVIKRLAELDAAIGRDSGDLRSRSGSGADSNGAAGGTAIGMREAIMQATAKRPLPVRDLVDAMQQAGFRFKSKKPLNSVGAYLYGKAGRQYFKKVDGGFVAK